MPGVFFCFELSNIGQELFVFFIKIYGGGRDFVEGVVSVVLSITEVLRTGGE